MLKPEDTVKIKAREPSGAELIILQLFVNISPFYKGVTVAEYQVIVVELFTCVPIKSPPAAVIIR